MGAETEAFSDGKGVLCWYRTELLVSGIALLDLGGDAMRAQGNGAHVGEVKQGAILQAGLPGGN